MPHHLELKQQLSQQAQRLHYGLLQQLRRKQERLERAKRSPFLTNPRRQLLMQPAERLDRLAEQLGYRMRQRLTLLAEQQIEAGASLIQLQSDRAGRVRKAAFGCVADARCSRPCRPSCVRRSRSGSPGVRHLDALSPLKVMQRGYSLAYDEQEKQLIRSITQVKIGDRVKDSSQGRKNEMSSFGDGGEHGCQRSETEVSFELAIEQLERIVSQLESGDVPLEKAIELYQEGVSFPIYAVLEA